MKPSSEEPEAPILRVADSGACRAAIETATGIIRHGGVVCFPTSGLYGLAADALNSDAVERVYKIKRRPAEKPLLMLVNGFGDLPQWVRDIPKAAERIAGTFWPGRVTMVFEAAACLPAALTGGTRKVGIRVPAHPVARMLVHTVGRPITATSANLSGQSGIADIIALDSWVRRKVDLILDAGPLAGGRGSTVVDVTSDPPVVLREGAVGREDLLAAAGWCHRPEMEMP